MWDARAQALPRAPRGGRPSRVRGRGPAEAPGIPTLGCTRRGSSEGPGRGGLAGEAPRASGRSRPLPCPPLPAALRAPGRAPPHARPPAGGGWSRPGLQGSGFWPRPNSPTLQRTEHTPAEHGEPAAAGGFRSSPPPASRGGKAPSGGGTGLPAAGELWVAASDSPGEPSDFSLRHRRLQERPASRRKPPGLPARLLRKPAVGEPGATRSEAPVPAGRGPSAHSLHRGVRRPRRRGGRSPSPGAP